MIRNLLKKIVMTERLGEDLETSAMGYLQPFDFLSEKLHFPEN